MSSRKSILFLTFLFALLQLPPLKLAFAADDCSYSSDGKVYCNNGDSTTVTDSASSVPTVSVPTGGGGSGGGGGNDSGGGSASSAGGSGTTSGGGSGGSCANCDPSSEAQCSAKSGSWVTYLYYNRLGPKDCYKQWWGYCSLGGNTGGARVPLSGSEKVECEEAEEQCASLKTQVYCEHAAPFIQKCPSGDVPKEIIRAVEDAPGCTTISQYCAKEDVFLSTRYNCPASKACLKQGIKVKCTDDAVETWVSCEDTQPAEELNLIARRPKNPNGEPACFVISTTVTDKAKEQECKSVSEVPRIDWPAKGCVTYAKTCLDPFMDLGIRTDCSKLVPPASAIHYPPSNGQHRNHICEGEAGAACVNGKMPYAQSTIIDRGTTLSYSVDGNQIDMECDTTVDRCIQPECDVYPQGHQEQNILAEETRMDCRASEDECEINVSYSGAEAPVFSIRCESDCLPWLLSGNPDDLGAQDWVAIAKSPDTKCLCNSLKEAATNGEISKDVLTSQEYTLQCGSWKEVVCDGNKRILCDANNKCKCDNCGKDSYVSPDGTEYCLDYCASGTEHTMSNGIPICEKPCKDKNQEKINGFCVPKCADHEKRGEPKSLGEVGECIPDCDTPGEMPMRQKDGTAKCEEPCKDEPGTTQFKYPDGSYECVPACPYGKIRRKTEDSNTLPECKCPDGETDNSDECIPDCESKGQVVWQDQAGRSVCRPHCDDEGEDATEERDKESGECLPVCAGDTHELVYYPAGGVYCALKCDNNQERVWVQESAYICKDKCDEGVERDSNGDCIDETNDEPDGGADSSFSGGGTDEPGALEEPQDNSEVDNTTTPTTSDNDPTNLVDQENSGTVTAPPELPVATPGVIVLPEEPPPAPTWTESSDSEDPAPIAEPPVLQLPPQIPFPEWDPPLADDPGETNSSVISVEPILWSPSPPAPIWEIPQLIDPVPSWTSTTDGGSSIASPADSSPESGVPHELPDAMPDVAYNISEN